MRNILTQFKKIIYNYLPNMPSSSSPDPIPLQVIFMNTPPCTRTKSIHVQHHIASNVHKLQKNDNDSDLHHVLPELHTMVNTPSLVQSSSPPASQDSSTNVYNEDSHHETNVVEEYEKGSNDEKIRITRKYQLGELLGKGSFAKVYLCTLPGHRFAMKIIPKAPLAHRPVMSELQGEINIHKTMNHKHICQFIHDFMDQDNFYMMLELCEHQSMRELMHKRTRLSEFEVSYYLSQIVDAVSYIHSKQVIHRDLKIDNLFLDKNLHIKVGDFGLAIHISTLEDTNYKEICGTPNYVAPETLKKCITKNQCFGVDIWSIGVICYTLLIGKPPFAAKNRKTTFQRILLNQYTFPPHLQLSDYAKRVVSMILQMEPSHRPSLLQIAAHPFIAQYDNKLQENLPSHCINGPPCLNGKEEDDGPFHIHSRLYGFE